MRRTFALLMLPAALLLVAACGDDDGASDEPAPPATDAPPVDDGVDDGAVEAPDPAAATSAEEAVDWFMQARQDGSGAEPFLTDFGADAFPDEIPLYDVADFEVAAVEQADASSFEVTVEVGVDDGSSRTEILFVGPGDSVDGVSLPFAIRGGTTG